MSKPDRSNVGDYGAPLPSGPIKASASAGMVVLALAVGFVIGFVVWAVLLLSSTLSELVWRPVTEGAAPWFVTIGICVAGGLIIGLWSRYMGGEPTSLEHVMGQVRQSGGYRVDNIGKSVVAFFLPLVFGGSVGPEAGLTGLIAAACGWISRTLKKAGLRVKSIADVTVSAALSAIFGTPLAGIIAAASEAFPATDEVIDADAADDDGADSNEDESGSASPAASEAANAEPNPDDYTFRRGVKLVLYVAAAFGALAGIEVVGMLFSGSTGLPRFEHVVVGEWELLWCIPCIAAGYVLAFLFHAANKAFGLLGQRLEGYKILRALLCGLVLGGIGTLFPFVLFSGEEQAFQLIDSWNDLGLFVLLVTAVLKTVATPMCINLGWRGGNLFPLIFAGISAGYGLSLATGADGTFCVTVVSAALLGGATRKPLLTLGVLLLCFPVRSIVWLGLACVIGSVIPIPKSLLDIERGSVCSDSA